MRGRRRHLQPLSAGQEGLTYGGLKRNGQLGVEVSHGGQQLRVVGRVDVDAAQEVQLVCQVVHALLVQRSRLTTGGHLVKLRSRGQQEERQQFI